MSVTIAESRKSARLFGTVRSCAVVVIIYLVVQSFVVQPFRIPSGSMMPTLLPGDRILVSKLSYGYSRYSLPLSLPLFSGRLLASEPRRGDIVVFRPELDDEVDFIKRIVGLPGDRIQVIGGLVHINGKPIERERIEDYAGEDACEPANRARTTAVKQWRETLPNGVTHTVLDCVDEPGFPDHTRVYTVPPGHYFMMGDNRDNSVDSRFGEIGFVPFENIVGRAEIIFLSAAEGERPWEVWRWSIRWRRFFAPVR